MGTVSAAYGFVKFSPKRENLFGAIQEKVDGKSMMIKSVFING